jgi:hypothetical protein
MFSFEAAQEVDAALFPKFTFLVSMSGAVASKQADTGR